VVPVGDADAVATDVDREVVPAQRRRRLTKSAVSEGTLPVTGYGTHCGGGRYVRRRPRGWRH
jgi:hypothetical protein